MKGPEDSEVEVTLLGTGGGYGESIVIKVGKSDWIIVDSCVNPKTKVPLAIEYFNEIGVDYKNLVKLIICTHWHDDHIKGISSLLRECVSAQFCIPIISSSKEFFLFVGFDELINSKVGVQATFEFKECIEILKKRANKNANRLRSDMIIYKCSDSNVDFQVCALSPSNQVVSKFDLELSELIKDVSVEKKSIVHKKPNDKSVALLIKFDKQRILLGADLEVGVDPYEGWLDVINHSTVTDDVKSTLYKVPHHGSENGYDIRIFDKLVDESSVLKLTPWGLGSKLPTAPMLTKYHSHSRELYITSPVVSSNRPKPKDRDKSMQKIIEHFNKSLTEVKFHKGFIVSRYDYVKKEGWKTELHHSAIKVEL